jgi:UDP-glucose 4-epimerase
MKKVIVTGGAGFIGYNLCKQLVSLGHKVMSIDNYSTGLESNHIEGVEYIREDICNEKKIFNLFKEAKVVFHLAALARIQPSFYQPRKYFNSNILGTFNICHICDTYNIPLIFSGSSSHHSGKYKNPYTFTKDTSEELSILFRKIYGMKQTIARFYNVYGPNHIEDGEYATVIAKWDKAHRDKKPIIIYGDGSKERDFTHVEDIVDGLIKIWETESYGMIFELGRGRKFSLQEVANLYQPSYGIVYKEDKKGEAQSVECNAELAKQHLGWEAKNNLQDWIRK